MTRDHDSFTQEFAGESVDLSAIQATIFEPEMVKAPVLPTPEPSETEPTGNSPARVLPTDRAHSGSGESRTQGVCLMTEFQEARSAALCALNRLLRSDASTADIRLEVDAAKTALESLLVLARGRSDA